MRSDNIFNKMTGDAIMPVLSSSSSDADDDSQQLNGGGRQRSDNSRQMGDDSYGNSLRRAMHRLAREEADLVSVWITGGNMNDINMFAER